MSSRHPPNHRAVRRTPGGNFRFPGTRNGVDVDQFLGQLAADSFGTPDLSADILSRVHSKRPFRNERARLMARFTRVAAAFVLCTGTIGFGAWLMNGGLDVLSPARPVSITDPRAAADFRRFMSTGPSSDVPLAVTPTGFAAVTSAAISGFMRTTVPAPDQSSPLADVLFLAAPGPSVAKSRPANGPLPSGQTLASAALRWTQSVLPVGPADDFNEADLADQFEREFRGEPLNAAASGVYNPR